MKSGVFRKISLDRLSSPEQLDQAMRVTTPHGWIGLAAIAALLVTAVVWGVVGELSDKVSGRGILVKSGGVLEVVSSSAGRVTDVSVGVGDSITEGQVVAWVAQPDLFESLQAAKIKLAELRAEHGQSTDFSGTELRLQLRNNDQQRANLEASIVASEESLRWLRERMENQERLVEQGLVTRATLLATRQQYEQMRERIRAGRSDLAQLQVGRLTAENRHRETQQSGRQRIEQMEREVVQMERDLKTASQITSPYTGRILEVLTEQGKIVSRGEAIFSLDLTGRSVQDLMAIVYVPSVHGKKVKPGMVIQIAPSTVRQEEYGMMLGKVTFVSSFPSTPRGMQRVLKNEQLVSELSGGGAPYEVHAELIVDPSTVSTYRWSSSQGPPTRIQSGTTTFANVSVATQRPIEKAIPLLRKWTGF